MPFNHTGNTANGNAMGALRDNLPQGVNVFGAALFGRTTNLPIYEVAFSTFRSSLLAGANMVKVVTSIEKDNIRDAAKGYRQPTDHDDRLGNLPVAPGGGVVYREYYLAGNGFTNPGFVRLVADLKNKRLYITPTHYDVWLESPPAAANANVNAAINPATVGARNPFYLLRMAGAVNPLFY
jgi:hypothetical protein